MQLNQMDSLVVIGRRRCREEEVHWISVVMYSGQQANITGTSLQGSRAGLQGHAGLLA